MPSYDISCPQNHRDTVFKTFAEQNAGDVVEQPCSECSGPTHIIVRDSGIIWNASGSTRGYGRSANAPELDRNRNFGHNPPTVNEMGLSQSDCSELGI